MPSKTCKLPMPILMHPHTIRDAGFWTESWKLAGRSPSSLARRTRRPWFPTRCQCQIWTRLTIEHFSTLNSHFNEPWPQDTTALLDQCSHMASFLNDRALVGICRWHGGLCLPTVVSGSIPGPFSNVNDKIMPISDALSSEGPKTTGIQQRSSALSLPHRDFSSFPESFDDVMHCRWWDLQSLCNLTLRNIVFKVFHNLFTHSFTDWRASAHLFFWETLPL